MMIDRQFLRLAEGLVHLRRLDGVEGDCPPLVLLHASPASSRIIEPLMLALRESGCGQTLIAPDTLGNGDSPPPTPADPDIAYFADSVCRLLDVAGIDRIDLYGSHTGARTAAEFAVRHPARIRRLILDGITEYTDEFKQLMLDNYAPNVLPDEYGRQFIWAFNFVRDQWLHFPYFMRDSEHRLTRTLPSPDQLHLAAIDVLKALGSYQKAYLAAFRYEARARLPLIEKPTLFLRPKGELANLNNSVKELMSLMQNARDVASDGSDLDKASVIANFLKGAA